MKQNRCHSGEKGDSAIIRNRQAAALSFPSSPSTIAHLEGSFSALPSLPLVKSSSVVVSFLLHSG